MVHLIFPSPLRYQCKTLKKIYHSSKYVTFNENLTQLSKNAKFISPRVIYFFLPLVEESNIASGINTGGCEDQRRRVLFIFVPQRGTLIIISGRYMRWNSSETSSLRELCKEYNYVYKQNVRILHMWSYNYIHKHMLISLILTHYYTWVFSLNYIRISLEKNSVQLMLKQSNSVEADHPLLLKLRFWGPWLWKGSRKLCS